MSETTLTTILMIPPLLVAVILHEIAHGLMAEQLGDPTARMRGRITLNPIKHIDWWMTILLPLLLRLSGSPVIFGGAKPVPVDARNFKNPRRDMGIVAIAGPVMNGCIALVSYALFLTLKALDLLPTLLGSLIGTMLFLSVIINVVLGAFNLLPFPPLDGGRIAVALLPLPIARVWARLERFGLIIIMLLLLSGHVDRYIGFVLEPLMRLFPEF